MNLPGKQPLNHKPENTAHVREDVKAYLDGELSLLRRWQVRWHLSRCAECREEVTWLNRLGEDMRDLERAQPRPELRQRIMASLPETPPGRAVEMAPLRPAFGAPRLAFAGACIALLGVGAFALPRLFTPPTQPVIATVAPPKPSAPTPDAQHPTPDPVSNGSGFATNTTAKPPKDPFSPNNLDGGTISASNRLKNDGDVINQKAKELYAKRLRERAAQEQNDWNRLLAQSPALKSMARSGIKPPLRLALAVSSNTLETSREEIIALTRKVGGTAYAPAAAAANDRTDTAPSVAPGVPGGHPPHLSGPDRQWLASANVLLLKVPAAQRDALLQSLRSKGTVSNLPSENASPAIGLMNRRALKPVVNADAASSVQAAPLPAPSPKNTKTGFVFVLIQMQAAH